MQRRTSPHERHNCSAEHVVASAPHRTFAESEGQKELPLTPSAVAVASYLITRANQPMPSVCVTVPQVFRDRNPRRAEQRVRAVRPVPNLLIIKSWHTITANPD